MADYTCIYPDEMTPEQRRAAVVAILARGCLRILSRPDKSAVNRETSLEAVADESVYARQKESKP